MLAGERCDAEDYEKAHRKGRSARRILEEDDGEFGNWQGASDNVLADRKAV